jgi:hypothetical protein
VHRRSASVCNFQHQLFTGTLLRDAWAGDEGGKAAIVPFDTPHINNHSLHRESRPKGGRQKVVRSPACPQTHISDSFNNPTCRHPPLLNPPRSVLWNFSICTPLLETINTHVACGEAPQSLAGRQKVACQVWEAECPCRYRYIDEWLWFYALSSVSSCPLFILFKFWSYQLSISIWKFYPSHSSTYGLRLQIYNKYKIISWTKVS